MATSDWTDPVDGATLVMPFGAASGTWTLVGLLYSGLVSDWSSPAVETTRSASLGGEAIGTLSWTGAATGARRLVSDWTAGVGETTPTDVRTGAVVGVLGFTGSATGVAPTTSGGGGVTIPEVIPFTLLAAVRTVSDWSLPATETTGFQSGTASGSFAFDSQEATGSQPMKGSASGTWTLTTISVGGGVSVGAAYGTWTLVGVAGADTDHTGEATGSFSWAGVVNGHATVMLFTPPTHEEAIRTNVRPLNYYRLTYADSIVRVNGTLTAVRTPYVEQLDRLVEGVDYFMGGHIYEISGDTHAELVAAGFIEAQS